jgi:hypothetical protein
MKTNGLPRIATTLAVLAATAAAAASPPASPPRESPFACDRSALSPAERKRHFDELGPALRAVKKSVRELPDGYELEFPADTVTWQRLSEWAFQERRCCPFFDIDLRLEREGGAVWMRLGGRPGTKAFIQADAGPWLKP